MIKEEGKMKKRSKEGSKISMKGMYHELNSAYELMSKSAPEYMKSFMEYFIDSEKTGILSEKTKVLISIAIAVTSKCLPCIAFHISNAAEISVTKKEILEACQVAVFMSGSPSFVYLKYVNDACEEFGLE
jgi:AhpD family alkylhydroperoxidase